MLGKIEEEYTYKSGTRWIKIYTTNKMALSNASSQTLSAPASPALLGATPTWDPRINPDPAWIHLGGMPGMEHLAAAAISSLAGTPPGSPHPHTGPAVPRQPTWSVAYGNPPPSSWDPSGPALGGLMGTPPGSPRPDTGPMPRQETWSIAYGNPPPWMREPDDTRTPWERMAAVPLTRSNALRITTHQEFTAEELDGEGTPPGWPSIPAPRAGARDSHWGRPQFMEPLTTGSSAVSSPIDRGFTGGGHIGGIILADYYPGLMPLPSPPAEPFVPQEPTVLPPSTPVPTDQD
jgi:hypothetical protein